MGERINHGVASQNRARADYRVTTDLGVITDDGAELAQPRCDRLVFVSQMDFFPVQSHIRQNHSCTQVGFVAENRVTDIVKMRDLGSVAIDWSSYRKWISFRSNRTFARITPAPRWAL